MAASQVCDAVSGRCRGICNTSCTCSPDGYCNAGEGSPCESNAHCSGSAPYCSPQGVCRRGIRNSPCDNDAQCEGPNLRCSPRNLCEQPTSPLGSSFDYGRGGVPCSANWDAAWQCVNSSVCVESYGLCLSALAYCMADDDCETGLCNQEISMCWQGRPGSPCGTDDDCAASPDLRCLDGVCKNGDVGAYCTNNSGCAAWLVCGPFNACQQGIRGAPCTDDAHCFTPDEEDDMPNHVCDQEIGVCRAVYN